VRSGGYSPYTVDIAKSLHDAKRREHYNRAEPQNDSSTGASLTRSSALNIKILAEPVGRSRPMSPARFDRRQQRVMPLTGHCPTPQAKQLSRVERPLLGV